jgi:hypothetical protein
LRRFEGFIVECWRCTRALGRGGEVGNLKQEIARTLLDQSAGALLLANA